MLHGRGIGNVDQGHAAVEFGANLEHAHHCQPLQTRGDTTWRRADFRHDQGKLVAKGQAKAARSDLANHHPELARTQILQITPDNMLGNDRHLAFLCRIDAADLDGLHAAAKRDHAVHLGKRHCRHNLGILERSIGHRAPVFERLSAHNQGVGHHAEDA